jgi:hypothetical protein
MSTIYGLNTGFLLHIIFECPACFNFFVYPSKQLGIHTPHAHAIVRQYAVLLLTSILVAWAFVQRPMDILSGRVAIALAVYHIAPAMRSMGRLRTRVGLGQPLIPSEAFLYLVVHVICFAALAESFWKAGAGAGETSI